jgi:predicted Zn-dependent protease
MTELDTCPWELMRTTAKRLAVGLLALLLAVVTCGPAQAQGLVLIRDNEIEAVIREITDPIFAAAGLNPRDVTIYLVKNNVLNAFVAGGQNVFIHTGLLSRAERPEQLAGVLAHETGHIAGGHLSRARQAIESAGYQSLIGALLGVAAAAAGAPALGTAIMAGGATVAQRGLLAYSRTQEQAADQAAVTYLKALELPPDGLREFFEILERSSLRIESEGNVYLRTHPLTRDRIEFIEDQEARSPYAGNRLPDELQEGFRRARAKLDAFLEDPRRTLDRYPGDGFVDRYARAIALYRVPRLDEALALVDELIGEEPDNPYLLELKGQMLFENGRITASIEPQREAVRLRPDSALMRIGLARALIEQQDPAALEEGAAMLREAVRLEPRNAPAWRFLGIAEGRLGRNLAASLALTEAAVLRRNRRDAELFLARARAAVRPGDPEWYRVQDLERAVEDIEERPG